jgi:hypothetical protein
MAMSRQSGFRVILRLWPTAWTLHTGTNRTAQVALDSQSGQTATEVEITRSVPGIDPLNECGCDGIGIDLETPTGFGDCYVALAVDLDHERVVG